MPERHYGIRHHGPGSARAVVQELDRQQPEVLLVEGPPEADDLVRWVADGGLQPPVALLGYSADDPRRAAFWPFAVFSPEWQAIRWAVMHGVPVRFFDLPYAYRLTGGRRTPPSPTAPAPAAPSPADGPDEAPAAPSPAEAPDEAPAAPSPADGPDEAPPAPIRPVDPIGELAAAAGYDDPERWWEDVVEHRGMPAFEAIAEAMTAIRETAPEDPEDLVREAYMRTVLRKVRRSHENIAVVCGAWHVPALHRKVAVKDDAAVLKGRKKTRVAFTWVPWTYGRLASWSGYGAGVRSPGWYHHLFSTADDVVPRWLVDAAGVLRAEGVPTSSAHVIEATRLAEALASLRGRPLAGLAEVTEAAEAVMCDGEPLRAELIGRKLVVGERLGGVPDDMPAVPLARDLAAQQRRLRLKPEALERVLELDLRRETDLGRSRLLHRLRILGVPWGEPDTGRRGTGTFREQWRLRWQPEFAISLVEGSMWGTTVVAAATAKVTDSARTAESLAGVTKLVEECLLADLTDAYPPVLAALDTRAALDADVNHLMAAIPALARTLRYGDVRRTDVGGLRTVTAGLLGRVCAGLPSAVGSLADEAAKEMRDRIDGVHAAIGLLDDGDLRERWLATLGSVSRRGDLHGLLAGRLTRLLMDAGRLAPEEVRRRLRLPLTVGTPPAHAAAWVEGFLAGGGLLLVHDDALLELLDEWLADIAGDAFDDVLPLLRRTFGAFASGERRAIGERIASGRADRSGDEGPIDHERAAAVLPTMSALLGRPITAASLEAS
jgi:nucleoid-associated protein YgaU